LRILASALGSGQHPAAQKVEAGTPVHGALDDLQILWGVRQATGLWHGRCLTRTRVPHVTQPYDPTKPPVALEHDSTLVVVIEMS
jgi:hypothetical protein